MHSLALIGRTERAQTLSRRADAVKNEHLANLCTTFAVKLMCTYPPHTELALVDMDRIDRQLDLLERAVQKAEGGDPPPPGQPRLEIVR